jgi:hypothetical protein
LIAACHWIARSGMSIFAAPRGDFEVVRGGQRFPRLP